MSLDAKLEAIGDRLLQLQTDIDKKEKDLAIILERIKELNDNLLIALSENIIDLDFIKGLRANLHLQTQILDRLNTRTKEYNEERHSLIEMDKGLREEKSRQSKVRTVYSLDDYRDPQKTGP